MFISCLLIAVFTWLIVALSQKYSYQINAKLEFVNIPQDRILNIDPVVEAKLKLEGTGWALLFSKLNLEKKLLKVDLKNLGNSNTLSLKKNIDAFNLQLMGRQKIISVNPEQISFDFSSRMVKKVPVRLQGILSYQKQYHLSSPILLFPDSVVVNGPIDQVEKINEWKTVSLNLSEMDDSVMSKVKLMPSVNPSVRPIPDIISVSIPVERFTEGNIELLLTMINNQEKFEVNLLPPKIKVKYFCPVSRFHEVQPDMFEVIVDLNEWKKQGREKLMVKMLRSPDFIRIVSIYPTSIDFIVNK
ncbi:YbbR-like protein [Solitalea koreensis]|uniref:YbbR-like protein n=1 Tax=Solitalea koreensis TaxID=543615 RepID=A0A521D7C0_9SPHI|nr:YbbR-like protein [Solitalea koreensis]